MAGLGPATHVLVAVCKDVDAWDKPAQDAMLQTRAKACAFADGSNRPRRREALYWR